VLTLLYAPKEAVVLNTSFGIELQALADKIVSQKAGYRFLGYLDGQRIRMDGGGNQARVPNRPELIEAHGYDTKYASHALRLGLQGIELMTTGHLSLPMVPDHLAICMQVKKGEVNFVEAKRRVDFVRWRLSELMDDKVLLGRHLRPEPHKSAINSWITNAHQSWWGWDG
jgi:hypothetical protein